MTECDFLDRPEWLVDWDRGNISHCHPPRFAAQIVGPDELLFGEHYKLESGDVLTAFVWADTRPCGTGLSWLMINAQRAVEDHLSAVVAIPTFNVMQLVELGLLESEEEIPTQWLQ